MNEIPDPAQFAGDAAIPMKARSGVGVLLINLGTPDATDAASVRHYLREFLNDRRVIEENTLLWRLVLNAVILPLRPRSRGRDYERIWNREKDESPLKTVTRSQAHQLAAVLALRGKPVTVDFAMRYGNPSIRSRLAALAAQGCTRVLAVPL